MLRQEGSGVLLQPGAFLCPVTFRMESGVGMCRASLLRVWLLLPCRFTDFADGRRTSVLHTGSADILADQSAVVDENI